jgi:hypothetical protein
MSVKDLRCVKRLAELLRKNHYEVMLIREVHISK